MPSPTLTNHFIAIRKNLLAMSEHLQIAEHGDIKGLAREAFITQFLKTNLPSQVDFKSGEIIDCNDNRSKQVDIIMQSFSSPRIPIFGNIQISLSDAVICAIEVKSQLKTGSWKNNNHLKLALENFESIKKLKRHTLIKGDTMHASYSDIPCVLFAFSGPTKETLIKKFYDYSMSQNKPIDSFVPELTIVLDRGYAIAKNDGWAMQKKGNTPFVYFEGDHCLTSLFVFSCKLIEVWNTQAKYTKFQEYFNPHKPIR